MLKRRESDPNFVIYPILAKSCAWRLVSWLSKIHIRPSGETPIWAKGQNIDIDTELTKISEEVTDIIKSRWFKNQSK